VIYVLDLQEHCNNGERAQCAKVKCLTVALIEELYGLCRKRLNNSSPFNWWQTLQGLLNLRGFV
jgi:hypothetical protein